jgi:hypothetical protein
VTGSWRKRVIVGRIREKERERERERERESERGERFGEGKSVSKCKYSGLGFECIFNVKVEPLMADILFIFRDDKLYV